MTIEPGHHMIDSEDVLDDESMLEVTEKRVAVLPRKTIPLQPQSHDEAVPQKNNPTTYDLSVVIPTRNEQDNIVPLLTALKQALDLICVEIIFVDDSDDDTPQAITEAAQTMNSPQLYICLEHRLPGQARAGGLATAVVEGMHKAQAEYIAVLDADLQHPPELLRSFYEQAVAENIDMVLASRYIKGGSYQGLANMGRRWISRGLKDLARLLFFEHLRRVSDPLGGFFLLRRALLTNVELHPIGYKIQLELLMRCPWQDLLEIPYHFRARTHGQSKANLQQGLLALQHMRKLWLEIPSAGRAWKIALLLLLNLSMAMLLFKAFQLIPALAFNLTIAAFGVMALLNFFLAARFLFPSPKLTGQMGASAGSAVALEDELTIKLPLVRQTALPLASASAIADAQTLVLQAMPVKTRRISLPSWLPASRISLPVWLSRKQNLTRKLPLIAAALSVTLSVAWMGYTQQGALIALAGLFIGAAVISLNRISREKAVTMLLAVSVSVATLDYVCWRFAVTNWQGWWVSIPLLFAETLGALHVLGFQLTVWPWRPAITEESEDPTQQPIFVFIPTVNEGVAILKPTLEGVMAARTKYLGAYPHGKITIVICNDGRVAGTPNWAEMEKLAKSLDIICVTRTKGGGAKAGNIENARQQVQATGDAFVVIFDADQVAHEDFFLRTIPPFAQPGMGWVQTGQYYSNLDNPTSNWADDQQSMFYNLLCPGKAALNAAFICGTNVVIRAKALDQIGGLPQDSVTEDFAASIALHKSWHSSYLSEILATGLGPLDVPSYLKQQGRWAMGTLGVLRTHWRDILLPQKNGLSVGQRLQYFLACTHYLCGLRDLIYVLIPILFIFTGVPAVGGTTLSEYLWHFIPYILLSALAMWYSARDVTGLRGIIIGFGSFPVLIKSLFTVIIGRKMRFAVTSKHRSKKRSIGYLWIYFMFLLLCLVSLLWMIWRGGRQQAALFISGMWVIYSIVMLSSFLILSLRDLRFQKASQKAGAVQSNALYPAKLLQRRRGLEAIWSFAIAALLAIPILMNGTLGALASSVHGNATPFQISAEKRSSPYFGLSVPIQMLNGQPQTVSHLLDTHLSIIGRTQDIQDVFDANWANQLYAQQTRPWITLQFGVFGAGNKAPLDADLPSIINGLHDQEISRWATEIRDYGKPIYLTILLHVDRNWSVSSAVANGGIPQDSARAWLHVQSIFRAAGAANIGWVWAPADPLNDQAYAPPASSIDAVLQSFIDYPATQWGDPRAVLAALTQHYPTKPIIVEASVNGVAAQKATWLLQLGKAIHAFPQIYALLYHEGGPDLRPTSAEVKAWSLESDPESLAAMREIATSLVARMPS